MRIYILCVAQKKVANLPLAMYYGYVDITPVVCQKMQKYNTERTDFLSQQLNVDEIDYSSIHAILDSENRSFDDTCMANSIWSFHN